MPDWLTNPSSGLSALLGAIIGGVVVILAEYLRGKSARTVLQEDRKALQQAALIDLQRQNLLALQEYLRSWTWAEMKVHEQWAADGACDDDVMEDCVNAAGKVRDSAERVISDGLRLEIANLRETREGIDADWNDSLKTGVPIDIAMRSSEFFTTYQSVSERLGIVLRRYLQPDTGWLAPD